MLPLRLDAPQGLGPLLAVGGQGGGQHQRVRGAVEAAVVAGLEPRQEEHHVGQPQGGVAGQDGPRRLLQGPGVALLPHAGQAVQVFHLAHEPAHHAAAAVGVDGHGQGGHVGVRHAPVGVAGEVGLQLRGESRGQVHGRLAVAANRRGGCGP